MREIINRTLLANAKQFVNESAEFRITDDDIRRTQGRPGSNTMLSRPTSSSSAIWGEKNGLPTVLVHVLHPSPSGCVRVKQFTKDLDIFSQDLGLIPIHHGAHWALVAVDMVKQTAIYYDSMLRHDKNNSCVGEVLNFLA